MSPTTRCDYDGVFYRVFCIILLAIGVTFSVILTNVFIDIDGLLSGKHKEKVHHREESTLPRISELDVLPEKPESFETTYSVPEDNTFSGEDSNGYRNKRSLGTPYFQMHLKNPKMKKLLTSHLAQLLEQLDEEESEHQGLFKKKQIEDTVYDSNEILDARKTAVKSNRLEGNTNRQLEGPKEDDMLHLTMHNILLQGIIGHMDLMEVYKKVHALTNHMEGQKMQDERPTPQNIEVQFFEEMARCDRLHKEIEEAKEINKNYVSKEELNFGFEGEPTIRRSKGTKDSNMLINTIIDITSLNNPGMGRKDVNLENIKGTVKLLYNGHNIKLKELENEENKNKVESLNNDTKDLNVSEVRPKEHVESLADIVDEPLMSDTNFKRAIADYFNENVKVPSKITGFMKSRLKKRLKRNVKMQQHKRRFARKTTTDEPEIKGKEEDELYVEIETHFDNNGITGQKKRKLIQSLVKKIRKAINEDINSFKKPDEPKKHKHIDFKKRDQSPLKNTRQVIIKKILIPVNQLEKRQSNPITHPAEDEDLVPIKSDKMGTMWTKRYIGPRFLSPVKAINSGEMGKVDLDYNKIFKNGIPQRLQHPLTSGGDNENIDDPTDLGSLKFYIRDLDGTGFSIGFNQYVGEAPDPEAINFLSNLKDIISNYHTNYDKESVETVETRLVENPNAIKHSAEKDSLETKYVSMQKDEHVIVRRSVDQDDNHSNEYDLILHKKSLPYETYQEIYEDNDKTVLVSLKAESNKTMNHRRHKNNRSQLLHKHSPIKLPFALDENLLQRKMNPSEILGLANLLDRNKRSTSVNKYARVNKHVTLVNTRKTKPGKIFFFNKKRAKRQTYDKIRIIASDHFPIMEGRSDENMYVVSDENLAEREPSSLRHVELEHQPELRSEESVFDAITPTPLVPFDYERIMRNYIPDLDTTSNIFSARSRHNRLMSKYPHILLDEISRSKEEPQDESPTIFSESPKVPLPNTIYNNMNEESSKIRENTQRKESESLNIVTEPYEVKTLFDALSPKPNYKLTVKIQPKNITVSHPGFKEIHTSINKSVNRDGLIYTSLVNVSQISKIETNSNFTTTSKSPMVNDLKDELEKIKKILRTYKIRMDRQMNRWKTDRRSDQLSTDAKDDAKDSIDVMLPLNPPQLLHMKKAEASQLISATLLKLHNTHMLEDLSGNHLHIKVNAASPPSTTTSPPSTIQSSATTEIISCPTTEKSLTDPDKIKILKAIQMNENLTNKILSKIDQNTRILQSFSKKLVERFEPPSPLSNNVEELRAKKIEEKYKHTLPQEWSRDPYLMKPMMPKLEIIKNGTNIIPFVYAYQQNYANTQGIKPESSMASMVYQGHIHTNTNMNKPPLNSINDNEKPNTYSETVYKNYPLITNHMKNESYFIQKKEK